VIPPPTFTALIPGMRNDPYDLPVSDEDNVGLWLSRQVSVSCRLLGAIHRDTPEPVRAELLADPAVWAFGCRLRDLDVLAPRAVRYFDTDNRPPAG